MCFNEKTSSPAGLNKKYSIYRKSTDSGLFWLPRSTFKVSFPNVQAKFQKKIPGQFPGEVVSNIVLDFELSIFKRVRGE